MRKHFRVTTDTDVEAAINAHMKNGYFLKFKEGKSGLYMFCPIIKDKHINDKVSGYSFLTLVSANISNFTRRKIKIADRAQALYRRMRWPGYRRYLNAIKKSIIINCPVTINDIKRSIHIYGPDVVGLRGKMTRRRPEPIGLMENIPLQAEVYEHHRNTMISVNYVFVHGLYHRTYIMNSNVSGKTLYLCSLFFGAGGHVGDIDRANRSLKEGTRCEIYKFPYRW